MPLRGTVKMEMNAVATEEFALATGTVPLRRVLTYAIDSTAAEITSDVIYQNAGEIAAGATLELDLSGTLTDYWGETIELDRVHALYVRNATVDADEGDSEIQVGGGLNCFVWWYADPSDVIEIQAGGALTAIQGEDAGWPVVAGTGDMLRLENLDSVNAASYEIVIIGESEASAATTTSTEPPTTTTTEAPTTTTELPTTTTT